MSAVIVGRSPWRRFRALVRTWRGQPGLVFRALLWTLMFVAASAFLWVLWTESISRR